MMKYLKAPLRVYWDLAPGQAGGLAPEKAAGIAVELALLKVFFVTLRFLEGGRPDAGKLIGALKKGGVRVTVSACRPDSLPPAADAAGADGIELCPEDAVSLKALLDGLAGFAPGVSAVSVSFVPTNANLARMKEVFSLALGAGIRTFNLPNPNLVHGGTHAEGFVMDDADRDKLKLILETLLKPFGQAVRLNVHDLFLHRALELPGLGGRIEYAGCQAGDAITYIHKSGIVYPCATWPVILGDLRENTFREIWAAGERKALRDGLGVSPTGCAGCPELPVCKGGCRGLAWVLCGPDCKDPNCKQPMEM